MIYKTFASLLMASAAMATPVARANSCVQASLAKPDWRVEDFSYTMTYKDPIQQQPLHNMTTTDLTFTIVNPAYDYKVKCTGTSYQDDKHVFVREIHGCEKPADAVWNDWTTFTYDENLHLHVIQTWTCPGNGGGRFTAQSMFHTTVGCDVGDEITEDDKGNQFRSGRVATCSRDDQSSKVTNFERLK